MTKKFNQGWRHFICFNCEGNEGKDYPFKEKSRDCYSPSRTDCPLCHYDFTTYQFGEPDDSIPIDKYGNLIKL